ncbi:MAG TPA: protein phosphatase 2C domain-containing protein [Candidatus Enterocloster faecavium]|uniref:Protein phosphatase 2C domain-containing protein n=1 Tax=Candidatus Enterocloster faecavium TaxID=2838560 RepID=A0A9D2L988_9FIRM|nr:protein phosphatase 2C domain-containing protein [Candidatus Enterocloster faecavium]
MMKLSYYAYTNRGGRPNNEDSIRFQVQGGRGVFVLADGLGGHSCGEVASTAASQSILEGCLVARSVDQEMLKEQMKEANRLVLEGQQLPGQEDMKTTAVALVIEGAQAFWAHVGDSRLYHFSDGQLAFATRDHSVTYMKYLGGEISYMDIYHDDDRSSLLRVLGKPSCQPETGQAQVKPGDGFLLCSDGFWEYVYQEEAQADLLKAETSKQWADLMLLRQIRRTPPGNDNFSVIAVFVEEGSM